jgi:hypothetical protein
LDRSAKTGTWGALDFPDSPGLATEIPDPRSVKAEKIAKADIACFLAMMDPPFAGKESDVRHKSRHRCAMRIWYLMSSFPRTALRSRGFESDQEGTDIIGRSCK